MTAYTDFHYSPTGSGVISGAQVLEQTEQGINGLGQYVQDNVSGAIDTANQALTIAQTADSNATLALNTANSFASAISAANNTANNALTTAQSAQNTANSASSLAATANNNAATALNTANSASAGVTTLTGTVNSLGNRMTAAENAISANAGNITTLQNNLATTNANVTAAANAASAAQATATSAQSTATQARNQAYVLRYTGTTITGGGTIAYADIDNTDNIKAGDKIIDATGAIYAIASVDIANQTVTVGASPVINLFCDAENLIPAATDTYDLGSSSYQWNNLYAKNYYYNGTAWGLDKSNTWSGDNTFSGTTSFTAANININSSNFSLGDTVSSNQVKRFQWYDASSNRYACIAVNYATDKSVWIDIPLRTKNTEGTSFVDKGIRFQVKPDNTSALLPVNNSVTNLGTSTNKWKTLNGINPGALSLPKGYTEEGADKDYINIASVIQTLDGTLYNYTLPDNGWISVRAEQVTQVHVTTDNWKFGQSFYSNTATTLIVSVPFRKGDIVALKVRATTLEHARFYPMQGNV